jgi:hypothetical protein
MIRTLTVTYEKLNDNMPIMCVAEKDVSSSTVMKMITGDKAEQLFKELIEWNMIINTESENKE